MEELGKSKYTGTNFSDTITGREGNDTIYGGYGNDSIVCDTGNTPRIDGDTYKFGDKIVKFDHHPDVEQYADVSIVNDELALTNTFLSDLVVSKQ